MEDRDPVPAGASRRPDQRRARARPRAVDLDDPDTYAAPGRPSRRSSWSRSTIADSRVRGRGSRIPRNH